MKNKKLQAAKTAKNDEFYTQMSDIEKEIINYTGHFKGMKVYCNCDREHSNFWLFFLNRFHALGLCGLVATGFDSKGAYKLSFNGTEVTRTILHGFGDFRSDECVELLKSCDIVCTNPPFSLFREYISLIIEYDKKFLVIGNNNAITYKEIFKLIKDNKIWLGFANNKTMEFQLSPNYEKYNRVDNEGNKFGNVPAISWFTNLSHQKRNEKINLFREYNPELYPKYDNYDAIEVSKVADIPIDYYKVMGVPITFLDKFNPEQFEIVGQTGVDIVLEKGRPYIKGNRIYARILIKRKSTGEVF